MNWYPWIVLLHVIGAFGFILAHGVSAFVAFRLRSEREPVRVAAMMDVSTTSLALLYVSLLVLLVAGIAAGLVGGHFSRLWIWIALAVLVAVMIAMYTIATPYYKRLRTAVGAQFSQAPKPGYVAPPMATPEELVVMLSSQRPYVLALVGGIGLVFILWLMVVKPF
jgi:hypothetical protein